jgi:ABC-type antimicrobial peptide transport system permease subunit
MFGTGIAASLVLALGLAPTFAARTGFRVGVHAALILWPTLLLTVVGLAAGHFTAWRATRVDPARALREECRGAEVTTFVLPQGL